MKVSVKELLKTLRPEIDAALAAVAAKHGLVSLRAAAATYVDGGAFTFKLEGVAAGGESEEATFYKRNARSLGLPPLGTKVTIGSVVYTLEGVNRTGTKVKASHVGGPRVLIPTATVIKYAKVAA